MKYDLTSDVLDFRPHVKGIYIYTCKADVIFDLDGLEVELSRRSGLGGFERYVSLREELLVLNARGDFLLASVLLLD